MLARPSLIPGRGMSRERGRKQWQGARFCEEAGEGQGQGGEHGAEGQLAGGGFHLRHLPYPRITSTPPLPPWSSMTMRAGRQTMLWPDWEMTPLRTQS